MAAAESARFGQFAEQTNVGPRTIEQFHADLRRIVSVYPSRPVYPLFVELRCLRDRVFGLLEGRQAPGQTRELYLIAAVLCAVLSNASFDLGNFAAAETQARTAYLAAELAGHNGMRAWIRGTQALIAYWDDRARVAVDLAEDGWRFTPETGTARVRLACIEARARARLRDAVGTDDALLRAERAREAVTSPDDPGGMMAFPIAKQQFYGGAARLWLGGQPNIAKAERLSAEAVELYETDPPKERRLGEISLARLDFAVARLAQSDLDGAAEQVEQVLEVGGQRRTESIARRLLQLSTALERPRFQTSALATTLRELIICSPIRTRQALPSGGEAR
ncbi:XRE family transcriptional regulator [Nocardia sp. NPDC049220]|uniref:XRE family transcriptional regulator n=1 Tax=Nocardia sp. NPDC049220 TaxID=3155273 RepID=UPI0033F32946